MESPNKKQPEMRDLLNKIVEGRIDANRRYVDEILEKVLEQNHRYYLEKMIIEIQRMELEEKAGNLHWAQQHRILAEAYKGILEKAFGITE